jgi:TIR domain-containing protein/PEGA domain-containing protein
MAEADPIIAISYRREDSISIAGRLYDRLQAEFGRGNVFMDFDSIPPGADFRQHIKQMIERSKLVIAIIGPHWLGEQPDTSRRIDNPADFVHLEIAYALERKLPVIPILVSNAQMPRPEELPKDIEELAFRNALSLDVGIDFHHHAERLVTAMNRLLTTPAPPTALIQKRASPEIIAEPTSLASPETQLTSTPIPTTSAKMAKPVPKKPPSVDITKQPSRVTRTNRLSDPAEAVKSAAEGRPTITQKPKGPTLVARSAALWRGPWMKVSAAVLRFGRLLTSIGTFMSRGIHAAMELLRRYRKDIALSAVYALTLVSAAAALYSSFQSSSIRRWLYVPEILTKNKASQPTPPSVAPQPSENPASAATSSSIASPAIPVSAPAALTIDSSPQGQTFELIAADGNRRSGTTPATFHDVPAGYAQVIFKRDGFADQTEAVWLTPDVKPAVTWNLPDHTWIPVSPQPNQQVTPATSAINPAAQNGRTWQAWMGDFVRQFVVANQSPDPNQTLLCYAPTVSYFDEGNKDQAYLRHDIEKYNERWPIRHDEIEGDIHLQEKVPSQQYLANFKLNFYAESPPRNIWTKGQFAIDLDITAMDGVPKISGIREKLVHQQKGKPGSTPTNNAPRKSYAYGIPIQGKPGFVHSPYAPSKGEIDIRRYPKGTQVKCPFTGRIFTAP